MEGYVTNDGRKRNAEGKDQPVRVGVDLTPMLPGSANGGSKFAILQLLEGLLQCHRDQVRLTLFVSEITRDELAARFAGRAVLHSTRVGREPSSSLQEAYRELRSQLAIRRLARREKLDVLYSPFGRYLMVPANVPLIALIMDLLHEDHPASIPWTDRLWRRLNLKKLAISGAQFQVPSEFTRERLHSVCRMPYTRIFRTYLPIHERLGPGERVQTTAFFFYPARPWAHKNHQNLLRAFQGYRKTTGTAAWRLVLTAGDDKLSANLRRLAGELGLGGDVDFAGDISEEQLAGYYRSAAALVFPSYYEGFGIPLLEAMHFGLPVICGRGGSQMEVAGDAALYVEAGNVEELAGAMRRIAFDADLRQRLADAGRRQLARFAWQPEVQALANAFQKVRGAQAGRGPVQAAFHRAIFVGFDLAYAMAAAFAAVLNRLKSGDKT